MFTGSELKRFKIMNDMLIRKSELERKLASISQENFSLAAVRYAINSCAMYNGDKHKEVMNDETITELEWFINAQGQAIVIKLTRTNKNTSYS